MSGILDVLSDGAHEGASLLVGPTREEHTLAALWERSADASRWFSERYAPGQRVAMVLEGTAASLAALVGAWRSGVTVVSLPLQPAGSGGARHGETISHLVELTEAQVVLGESGTVTRWGRIEAMPPVVDVGSISGGRGPLRDEQGDFVQCSSGTTGHPKAVWLRSSALAANVRAIVARYDTGTPVVSRSWLPLSHDMGLVGMMLAPWGACGLDGGRPGQLHLLPPESFIRAPRSWMRACSDVRATVTAGPCFALDAAAAATHPEDLDLGSLEVVCVGAEPVWPEVLRRFEGAMEPHGLRDTVVSPAYGMAEASLGVTASGPGERWTASVDLDEGGAAERELTGLGRPLDGVEVRVDGSGEVWVRSDGMMSGYIGRPPVLDDGWYRTGDLGLLAGDELVVRGRTDDLVFAAGRNVHATEAEHAIVEQVGPSVAGCAVVPDGQDLAVVAALVPGAGDPETQARDLKLAATAALGMAPSRVLIVSRRTIPRTGTGKLRRRLLTERLAAGELPTLHEAASRTASRRRSRSPEAAPVAQEAQR